jgi:hypothetical protein
VEAIANELGGHVSNAELLVIMRPKGFRLILLNHGGSWNFDFGKVKYIAFIQVHFLTALTNPGGLSRRTQKTS